MVTFSDQYQLRLTKKHNSFHFEFVLRELSYDHVNAVPSLLQRFFSLVFIFSKGCMSSRNFPFVFYCTLLLKKVWTFWLFQFPVITLFLSVWFHHCRLNSWNINNINKNCKILDYRSILLTNTVFCNIGYLSRIDAIMHFQRRRNLFVGNLSIILPIIFTSYGENKKYELK